MDLIEALEIEAKISELLKETNCYVTIHGNKNGQNTLIIRKKGGCNDSL